MNLQQIAALTYKIHERLIENITNNEDIEIIVNRRWRTAIGSALYCYFNRQIDFDYSVQYHQFKLEHQLRANYSNFLSKNNELELNDSILHGDTITIAFRMMNQPSIIQLTLNHFPNELWTGNEITVLKNQLDVAYLFDIISQNINAPVIQDVTVQITDVRYSFFHQIYSSIFQNYKDHKDNLNAKNYYDILLGAGVFYLPQNAGNCWSHYISYNAIHQKINNINNSLVRDHICSRKRTANFLLNKDNPMDLNQFIEFYNSIFSKFSYVTSQENQDLINWHLLSENQQNLNGNNFIEEYTHCAAQQNIIFHHFPNVKHRHLKSLINFIRVNNINIDEISSNEIELAFLNQ
jgi:hypothetical protein